MPQHIDTVLPLLSECVSARDALPLQAALATAFADLGLPQQRAALEAARSDAELRVTAAKLLRELMQQKAPKEPEAAPPRRTSQERKRAAVQHAQRRALADQKTGVQRPTLQPVESISGVGDALGQALRTRGVSTLGDLIWLLPLGYSDERKITPIAE